MNLRVSGDVAATRGRLFAATAAAAAGTHTAICNIHQPHITALGFIINLTIQSYAPIILPVLVLPLYLFQIKVILLLHMNS